MRFGINLRGDLAKLDDAEIASRYEALTSKKEAHLRAMPAHARSKLLYRITMLICSRGPFHGRIFYKIQALVLGVLSLLQGGGPLPTHQGYDGYLMECELRDVTDEIKRRVRRQKTALATS